MKIWKLSQNQNGGYDTYDSIIVCAETEDEARNINPHGDSNDIDEDHFCSGWICSELPLFEKCGFLIHRRQPIQSKGLTPSSKGVDSRSSCGTSHI